MTAGVLLLLIALPDALAFDVLKTEALLPRCEEVSARAGTTVVVAAAGGAADSTLKRLVRAAPQAPVLLERVSLMGDAESDMTRLLERMGKPCGLRVSPGGIEGEWIVSEHGACGGVAVPVAEGWTPPVEGDPAAEGPPEGGAPEVSAPPPRPLPVRPELTPARLLLLDHTVPDPTTALMMSAVVGFGSGEFYAHNPRAGWVHAAIQGTTLAVFGIARLAAADPLTETGGAAARAVGGVALTISLGARLVEAASSPGDAQAEAGRQIEREMR